MFDIGWEDRKRDVINWVAEAGGKIETWELVISQRAIWVVFTLPVKKRWIDDLPKPEELAPAVKTYGDATGRTARDEAFAKNLKDAAGKVTATFSSSGFLVLLGLYLLATSKNSTGEERPRKRRVSYE